MKKIESTDKREMKNSSADLWQLSFWILFDVCFSLCIRRSDLEQSRAVAFGQKVFVLIKLIYAEKIAPIVLKCKINRNKV